MARQRLSELGHWGSASCRPATQCHHRCARRVGGAHDHHPRQTRIAGRDCHRAARAAIREDYCYAGYHSFNGNGGLTGLLWLASRACWGRLSPLLLTHQVGVVRDALVEWAVTRRNGKGFFLPVVAET
ncbi:MAG: P1 family peptidase [Caldilineaceae bacterium]